MNMSFYVGAIGAGGCTKKLSVISDNLVNISNTGFKSKSVVFSELVSRNLDDSPEAVTELQTGVGIGVQRTSTGFDVGGLTQAGGQYDYAITQTNAFFMIQGPETGERVFTRNDHFRQGEWGEGLYLMTESDELVPDQNQEPIKLDMLDIEKIRKGVESGHELGDEGEDENKDENKPKVSPYTFTNPSRLASADDDEFSADSTGMEPVLVEWPSLAEGTLETSGTDMARGWARLIERQRTFSYASRMVTVPDEIEGTINTLRG